MQYYGSVVDNETFGSGNKVLHNVVGGAIGVLEGNSGDLLLVCPCSLCTMVNAGCMNRCA